MAISTGFDNLGGLTGLLAKIRALRPFSISTQQRRRRVSRTPSEHLLRHEDFNIFAAFFMGILPDPDEVLKKAGLTPSAYRATLTDAHVAGSLLQRKSRTKRSKLVILPDNLEDPKSVEAKDLVEGQINNIDRMKNVINEILEAPYFGATYLELFWNRLPVTRNRPNGEIVLIDIQSKPYEWFGYTTEGKLGIKTILDTFSFNLNPIPENKIQPVVKDGSFFNPYGDRAVKRVFWPYQFKKGGFRFWVEMIEKYGMPFLFGKLESKKSDDDLKEFHDELVDMVRNGIVVTKSQGKETVEVVEAKGRASSTDAYKTFKDAMNIEISKAILGETLTIENSETGSQAATKIHLEILESIQDEDKGMVEDALNRIFKKIVLLNMGPDVLPPTARMVDPKELSLKQAERDVLLVKDIGVKFNKTYVSETYRIEEDQFEMGAPTSTSPFGSSHEDDENTGHLTSRSARRPRRTEPKEKEDEEKEETSFQESDNFPIQKGIDDLIDATLSETKGVTRELKRKIKKVVLESDNYGEFVVKMATLADSVDSVTFSKIFAESLNLASIVGEWAVQNQKN